MKIALLALFLALPATARSATGDVRWYDSEVVHNTVHDMDEKLEAWSRRLAMTDPQTLRRRFTEFARAVEHMHDEMHDPRDGDRDAARVGRAFRTLQAPLRRLLLEVKRNQLRVRKGEPYRDELFDVLDLYTRLKFYMTPA